MQMEASLLQKYRRDRRKLLDFFLSSDLIPEIRTPPGAAGSIDVDLDTLSADYVIECAKSGGVLDLSEATKKYYSDLDLPITMDSPLGSSYFLLSEPELSGSPPRRVPPQVGVKKSPNHLSCSSNPLDPSVGEVITNFRNESGVKYSAAAAIPCQPVNDAVIHSLGLPIMITGLSDDDVRTTAYEVLLASVISSGGQIHSSEEKKKEKKSRLLTGLKSKRDKFSLQPQSSGSHFELLDLIRIQMEISEAMDSCTRQSLMQFASRTIGGQIDVPQISLDLVSGICKFDFLNERSYMQWQKRQANILEELLHSSPDLVTDEHTMLRCFLAKLRNVEEWDVRMSPSERAEVLTDMRRFASKLSSMPGKFGIQGETYYWASGYHLNVRLYEKLLFSVFDVLEESQLVEEVEDILSLFKLTWSTLGITQRMHKALYGWVLFQQFVATGEETLLEYAILEMQNVHYSEDGNGAEETYMNNLICSIGDNGNARNLSLLHAIFLSMRIWSDSQLQDYHLHFCQKSINFGRVVTLAATIGMDTIDDCGDIKLSEPLPETKIASKRFQYYVERSVRAAYRRVLDTLDTKSSAEKRHPLAILADEVKLIAERESTVFSPVLCYWYPEAGMLSAMLLHELYGEKLKPFLDGVSNLSEDVTSVLPAAYALDLDLSQLFSSSRGESFLSLPFGEGLPAYKIREVCGPIILQWVNAQHDKILEWTERAFHLEDWEPLASQQRQAASIIEVFRIIEETIDQFFGLNLPVDIVHLQSLLFGVRQSLEAYLLKLLRQLVDKKHLFPSVPALTRYKETQNLFIKKKSIEHTFLEETVQSQLNELSTSKLCVRLNTLHYIQKQMILLEDSIRECWMLVRGRVDHKSMEDQLLGDFKEELPTCSKSVDDLFVSFNCIKETANDATNKICEFIGARVMFWDLRDSFLFSLYRGSVESAHLESHLPQLDTVLDQICGLIFDSLRDQVVLSICQASLDGYVWILLDGGPSRVFSDTDLIMMQEDLNTLKDFFIAEGQGLRRVVVEQEAELAQQILNLYTLQTETIIGMLMSASELISIESDCTKPAGRYAENAETLLRVLCHKKDREASKFLKRQYQLPKSSDYEDTPVKESTLKSPLISDLLKRSTSFRWNENGQRSLKSIKKKLQEATSEIRHAAW